MISVKFVAMKCSSWTLFWLIPTIIPLIFCTADLVSSAEKNHYYLHISSFRLKKRAVQDVERIQNQGYNAITSRERIPNKGYWYRVYIGPFSSLKAAKLKRKELRSRKLVEYAAIQRKESLIRVELEERKVPIEVEEAVPRVSLPPEVTPAVPEEPVEVPPAPEKPPAAKEVPVPIPSMEEREEVIQLLPAPPPEPPARISAKPARKRVELTPKGSGRNMGRGNFSLGLRHTYREVEPELAKRKRITSDGTATTIEDIPVADVQKDHFPTRLHMDSLRIRFGLTDYLEAFAEIGGAYRELSDIGFAYGGGLRLNLFEAKRGWFRGFYGGLQGEYLGGDVEYKYDSSAGSKWIKEADWEEFVAKGELGVVRSWFSTYVGAAYFHYREDTKRQLVENLHPSLTSYVLQDELEDDSLGAFGGFDINLTSTILLNVEGQYGGETGIFGTLEYYF